MNSHESLGLNEVSKDIWTLFLPWNPHKSPSPTLRFGREVCERKRPPRSKPRHWKPLQQQQLLLLLWNVLTKAKCLIPALVLQFLVPLLSMLKALYLLLLVLLQRRKYTLSKWKKTLRATRQNRGEFRPNALLFSRHQKQCPTFFPTPSQGSGIPRPPLIHADNKLLK